jgi:hypothetical protein
MGWVRITPRGDGGLSARSGASVPQNRTSVVKPSA